MEGAVTSIIVKVAVVVEAFPQASVAVKVTIAEPVALQRSLSVSKLWVQLTDPEQISVAAAPPLDANHAFRDDVFPVPSHSTVRSEAGVVMEGTVISCTIIICEAVELFPQSSVAVQVRVTL